MGQSTTTTYTPDLANGGQTVLSASTSSDHTQSQITQSLNGRQVPLEQHQERVIRSDANSSVTESIVRRSDPTGQFVSSERTVTETHKNPDGSSTVQATTYRSDINGGDQLAERRTTETHIAGKTTTVDTAIDQPGTDGGLQTVEKRSDVTLDLSQGTEKKSSTTESIYRALPGQSFHEAVRKVTTQTTSGDKTVEDTADYEPGATVGDLQFQERRVSTTTKTPSGGQATIVDVYAPAADGVVQSSDEKPQLKQEQIITRVQNPDGSVVDTLSVRESNLSHPTELGAAREITRTVCTGNCGVAPAAPAPAPPTPAAPPAKP